ncbi:uncharacterized protein LOC143478449 isoform X2 [Brachyhypopomus gauderio]|uniref:uncharacterized protein LOC143478449 isoform X2 n=1 Tax=Brachyhypopomus gauderio TaxID=698409 RepID=UPI004041E32B
MDMCLPIEISVLLLVTLVHRCVETCNEGQFALQDSTCCPLCVKGWYVNQNCTKTSGVSCLPCKCENGSRMIANCTWFSNTECENVNISPNDVPKIYNLYAVAATTVTVLLVVGVWRWCITHKSEEHPATTRKKTATAATGGGPPVAVLTPAEDLALEQNSGRPIIVGIEGGTSSDPVCPHDTQPYVKGMKICHLSAKFAILKLKRVTYANRLDPRSFFFFLEGGVLQIFYRYICIYIIILT